MFIYVHTTLGTEARKAKRGDIERSETFKHTQACKKPHALKAEDDVLGAKP